MIKISLEKNIYKEAQSYCDFCEIQTVLSQSTGIYLF